MSRPGRPCRRLLERQSNMSERSLLENGRFLSDLGGWTGTGTAEYQVGDGDEHYGVAALLVAGDAVAQDFAAPLTRQYTVHFSVKCSSAITAGQVTAVITDEDGNVVKTIQPTALAATWTENETTLGLTNEHTYTLTISHVSAGAAVKVDDVWIWHVPMTRAGLAERVHSRLGQLATDRSLSTTTYGAKTEGDYTYAVDAGLRQIGAVDEETGLPDVRALDVDSLNAALGAIEQEMLEELRRDYAAFVDVKVGPLDEKLSQTAQALDRLVSGGSGGSGRVVSRRLRHVMAEEYAPPDSEVESDE